MELIEFLKENPQFYILINHGYKDKIAIADFLTARNRNQLWLLDDYLVTSVSKGGNMADKKNIIMDATLLNSLQGCGRYADLRYNLQLDSTKAKGDGLQKGSVVHKIIEEYYKAYQSGSNKPDAILKGYEAGRAYIKDEKNKISLGDDDIKLVFDTMQQYFEFYKNDSWIPIDVEKVKQVMLYEDDEIRIIWKAKLDLTVDTNNGIYPVDHKTMSRASETLSLNNQFMGQCVVMKTRGMIVNKIGFQKTLKPVEKFLRPMINYTLDNLTEWSQVIVPYWARMYAFYDETGYWPPNYTHCESKYSICRFKQVCTADTGMREEVLRLHYIKGERWDVLNEEND